MKIEMVCENKVRLLLEAEDLDYYGLTFEEIDYDRPATQRAFRDMLNRARKDVGFSSDGCRLLVEAHPAPDGGCVLLVTKQPLARKGRSLLRKAEEELCTYSFEQIDHLLDLLPQLCKLEESTTLYRMDGNYYATARADGKAHLLLREFGVECPARIRSLLEQRGTPLPSPPETPRKHLL